MDEVRSPLYGHTNIETAYLVSDYPYSGLRCRIRYWLEENGKKGFRFLAQTENPKTLRWNAPKKSTYMLLAGNMFLDELGHCHWAGLSEYSSAKDVFEFIRDFPNSDLSRMKAWILGKMFIANKTISGQAIIAINGRACSISGLDKEMAKLELVIWKAAFELLPQIKE